MMGALLAQIQPPEGPVPEGPGPIDGPEVDWLAVGPEVALMVTGVVLVLIAALNRGRRDLSGIYLDLSLAGVAASAFVTARIWNVVTDETPYQALANMVVVDGFSVFARFIVLAGTALALLVIQGYLRREGIEGPECHALVLLSASGMLLMTSANDLIVVFLALEILSISLYVLAAFDRRRLESQEAGLKYFVLGSFSSAVFLYGVALVYGATGTTSLSAPLRPPPQGGGGGIAQFLAANTLFSSGLLLAGIALLLVGLGFKVAAVPFHMWTPDVYQGAPSPVTGFMAAGAKAAGFAALLRVFGGAFGAYSMDWQPLAWVLAVASLVVGSVVAIVQEDVKRMLAYSSIAHAGYVLMGFQAGTSGGFASALFYLFTYTFMIVGSFAVVTVVGRKGDHRHRLDDYRGLGARQPLLAGALTLFLLSQAGVPLTAGFMAKFSVFSASAEAEEYALVVVGVLAAVVAMFFYLRLIVLMYMTAPADEDPAAPPFRLDASTGLAVGLAAAATVVLGVLPGPVLDFARDATLLF